MEHTFAACWQRCSISSDPQSLLNKIRGEGFPHLALRGAKALPRRLRDHLTARRLHAPGFRAGKGPRLLGLSRIELGEDFHAGDALWLEAVLHYAGESFAPVLRIGAHARLSDNVHIGCLRSITIGAHLLCGSRVLISDHAHGCYSGPQASDPAVPPAQRPLFSGGAIVIGDNVWLGDGVAVLAGAQIGAGCVVGANAVVRGILPPGTLAVGVPARAVRRWNAATGDWVALTDGS